MVDQQASADSNGASGSYILFVFRDPASLAFVELVLPLRSLRSLIYTEYRTFLTGSLSSSFVGTLSGLIQGHYTGRIPRLVDLMLPAYTTGLN